MIIDKILAQGEHTIGDKTDPGYEYYSFDFNPINGSLIINLQAADVSVFQGDETEQKKQQQEKRRQMMLNLHAQLLTLLNLPVNSSTATFFSIENDRKLTITSNSFQRIEQYIRAHPNDSDQLKHAFGIINFLSVLYFSENHRPMAVKRVLENNTGGLVRVIPEQDTHQLVLGHVFPNSPDAPLRTEISNHLRHQLRDALKFGIAKLMGKPTDYFIDDTFNDSVNSVTLGLLSISLPNADYQALCRTVGITANANIAEARAEPRGAVVGNGATSDSDSASSGSTSASDDEEEDDDDDDDEDEQNAAAAAAADEEDEDAVVVDNAATATAINGTQRRDNAAHSDETREVNGRLDPAIVTGVAAKNGMQRKDTRVYSAQARAVIGHLDEAIFSKHPVNPPTHKEKNNLIISMKQIIYAQTLDIDVLSDIYHYLNREDKKRTLNVHENRKYDAVFFKTNTNSWQQAMAELRNKAFDVLIQSVEMTAAFEAIKRRELPEIKHPPEDVKKELKKYLEDDLFCEHRSNNHFRNLFHATTAVQKLHKIIDACDAQIAREKKISSRSMAMSGGDRF